MPNCAGELHAPYEPLQADIAKWMVASTVTEGKEYKTGATLHEFPSASSLPSHWLQYYLTNLDEDLRFSPQ
jgi:hypothetical protein